VYKIAEDGDLLSCITGLHKKYCIDAYVCGQLNNDELLSIKKYVEFNNLLLLAFGMSLSEDNLSKNIFSLSPTQDMQVITVVNYMKKINDNKKYIITCSNNFPYSTQLVNDVKFELNKYDNIILDSSITYDSSTVFMNDIYNKIKMQISLALSKGIEKDNIYLYFVSSYEILDFIKYLIVNDKDKLLESINWFGADTNYIIFEDEEEEDNFDISCIDLSDNDLSDNDLSGNSIDIYNEIKLYLVNTNFIVLAQNYYISEENNKIIKDITDHPSSLEMYDSLWILIMSFLISRSYDNNKLKNVLLNISNRQLGLTGDLALNLDGSRKYYKYVLKQASFKNNSFKWKNIKY